MMKTIIIVLLLGIISLGAKASSENNCANIVGIHLNLIGDSDNYFYKLSIKKKTLSSYEITVFNNFISSRFLNLKTLQSLLKKENSECYSPLLADAISHYDYRIFGERVLKNTALRRIFKNLPNQFGYSYKLVKSDYKYYTSNKFVKNLNYKIKKEKIVLPANLNIKSHNVFHRPRLQPLNDLMANSVTYIIEVASKTWGYISDHVIWRNGHLNNNQELINNAKANLKAFDIIYEQRKFTLSNLTIPGHWGHTAIWLGTKEELIELGIWDLSYFEEFRNQIEEGKNIVEMRKEGIVFKSLDDFLNIDEFAVTRVKDAQSYATEIVTNLYFQLDRKYDFRFDALSINRITCTELIAFSYGDLPWKHSKTFFQVNIRPDDLAKSTLGINPFADIVFYVKGTKHGISYLSKKDWLKTIDNKNKTNTKLELAEK